MKLPLLALHSIPLNIFIDNGMSKTGKLRQTWSKALLYVQYRVPTGLRAVVGVVLIACGGLGFGVGKTAPDGLEANA